MGPTQLTVYVASSVGIDYFYFLIKTIKAAGYEVKEISLIPELSYRRQARESGVKKVWLRTKMYVLYPLFLLFKGMTCEPKSVFVVSSNTFYAPFLVHSLLRFRGIKVVHMLYDLYPDALEIAGGVRPGSLISHVLGLIAKANQHGCDGTVYLGNFLRQHAEFRWGKADHGKVIDISTDLSLFESAFPSLQSINPLIIHYGGQLGHLHDCHSIIECVRGVYESDVQNRVRFVFYVSGAQAESLRKALRDYPAEVVDTAPSQQWRNDIKNFHIGLVSLTPAGASVCLPSKTYAMMAGGLAIIAICPLWSDLAALVRSADGGWIINNSFYEQSPIPTKAKQMAAYLQDLKKTRPPRQIRHDFVHTIQRILASPDDLMQKRQNAFYGIRDLYGIQELQHKWHHIIQSL